MHLSQKSKTFYQNSIQISESTGNLEHFEKEVEPHSFRLYEIIHSEKRGYQNEYQVLSQKILHQSTCWRIPNTVQISQRQLLSNFFISVPYIMLENVPFSQILNLRTVYKTIASQCSLFSP